MEWVERNEAEKDWTRKQIIPYVCLRHGNKVFTYRRSTAGGEGRLHGKISIGIGGHIKKELDYQEGISATGAIRAAMLREVHEEIYPGIPESQFGRIIHIGFVNDDSDEVGLVHFGVVYLLQLDQEEAATVKLKEPELVDGKWMVYHELQLQAAQNNLETWSRAVYPALLFGSNGTGI